MYKHIDSGRIDRSKLPKRVVLSDIAKAVVVGNNYESARRTLYKMLHNGSIVPPQMAQGTARNPVYTWDRDILCDHFNFQILKDAKGRWHDVRDPERIIPIWPGFCPKDECEAHLAPYRGVVAEGLLS